jgi:hypothetical protein
MSLARENLVLMNNTRESLYYLVQRYTNYPAAFWYGFRHHGQTCDRMIEIGLGWRLRQLITMNPAFVKNFYIGNTELRFG